MCFMPMLVRYLWSRWLSLPLKGALLSLWSFLGTPCLLNTSEKAWMLSSALVPLTTATSGYLVRPSMTTRMWCPSWVGPQWSAYSLYHGSSGAFVGFRGTWPCSPCWPDPSLQG